MSVTQQEIDSLDDLDDLLDDFDKEAGRETGNVTLQPDLPELNSNIRTKHDKINEIQDSDQETTNDDILPQLGSTDFAKQLQKGMEELMAELETSPDAKRDFEQLMSQMQAATLAPDAPPSTTLNSTAKTAASTSYPNNPNKKASKTATPKNFAETVDANLTRMKESSAAIASSSGLEDTEGGEGSDAFMAEMMKQFEAAAGEQDGDFSTVLEGMMSQLMSKEILYEPLLELNAKYPAWIAANQENAEIEIYRKQAACVALIVDKFEEPGYRDEDPLKKAEVTTLMSKMQELGSPPTEIIGDDLGILGGEGGMPKLGPDGECSIM